MTFYQIQLDHLPKIHLVDEAEIGPPYIHRQRQMPEYILYIIRQGEMHLEENGVQRVLKPGDLYLLDPQYVHKGVKATQCTYFYIHFFHSHIERIEYLALQDVVAQQMVKRKGTLQKDTQIIKGEVLDTVLLPKYWHIENVADQVQIYGILQQAIHEVYRSMENYPIVCACKVQEVFIAIGRSFLTTQIGQLTNVLPQSYYKVQQIQDWLNCAYAKEITGELLEVTFEGNFDYMNRIFKKVTGQTIFQYLTHIRIEHAKRLLQQTTMHTGIIGEKVGYPDAYYFSKVFKKQVGLSPTAYAEALMQKSSL